MFVKHVAVGVMYINIYIYIYIVKYWLFHSYILYSNLKEFV